jgi:SET domain-containing protein
MLLILTEIRLSPIHGMGLFSLEPILAGTLIYRETPQSCVYYTDEQFATLPEPYQSFVRTYAYHWQGRWVLGTDNDRYTNHSEHPNTGNGDMVTTVALRDIAAGEEITANYFDFDAHATEKLSP